MTVSAVPAEVVRPLRALVLRPGLSPEQTAFDGDDAASTMHAAIERGGELAGAATVMLCPHPVHPAPGDWRIRGMATAPQWRGIGLGGELLAACLEHARAAGGRRVWCNARIGARTLYERGGMSVEGEAFEIPPIGTHLLMSVRLDR